MPRYYQEYHRRPIQLHASRAREAVIFMINALLATEEHVWEMITPRNVLAMLKTHTVDEHDCVFFFEPLEPPSPLTLSAVEYKYADLYCTMARIESMKGKTWQIRSAQATLNFRQVKKAMEEKIDDAIYKLFPLSKPSRMVYQDSCQGHEVCGIRGMLHESHVSEYERLLHEWLIYRPQEDQGVESLDTLIKLVRHQDYIQTLLDEVRQYVYTQVHARNWELLNYQHVLLHFYKRLEFLPNDSLVQNMYMSIKRLVPECDEISIQALLGGSRVSSAPVTLANIRSMLRSRCLLSNGSKRVIYVKLCRLFSLQNLDVETLQEV